MNFPHFISFFVFPKIEFLSIHRFRSIFIFDETNLFFPHLLWPRSTIVLHLIANKNSECWIVPSHNQKRIWNWTHNTEINRILQFSLFIVLSFVFCKTKPNQTETINFRLTHFLLFFSSSSSDFVYTHHTRPTLYYSFMCMFFHSCERRWLIFCQLVEFVFFSLLFHSFPLHLRLFVYEP